MITLPNLYFGPLSYYQLLGEHREVVIEAKEFFVKQSFRNRCTILSANGLLDLSIPIKKDKTRSKTAVDEIVIADDSWKNNHIRAIKSAYAKAPYFEHYIDDVVELINAPHEKLFELNKSVLNWTIKKIQLPLNLHFTTSFEKELTNDYRGHFHPKHNLLNYSGPSYYQVFSDRSAFQGEVSILDLIMNEGPNAISFLYKI